MKRIAIYALLVRSTLALADTPPTPVVSPLKATPDVSLSPLRLLPSDLDRIEHRARVRRNIGIGLVIPGVVSVVFGAVLIGAGVHDPRYVTGDREIAAGVPLLGAGVLFAIPGTYLWVDGQDGIDTSAWRRNHN